MAQHASSADFRERANEGRRAMESSGPQQIVRITIVYDEHDVILGIFAEFAELPADGRSGARKWK